MAWQIKNKMNVNKNEIKFNNMSKSNFKNLDNNKFLNKDNIKYHHDMISMQAKVSILIL